MVETAARLLRLLSLLQSGAERTGPELAERLGVTTRTVRRDVDRLRTLGYPVDATLGPVGGYRLAPGATLPPLLLDDDEAVAVAVCLRTGAGGSVAGVHDAALAALSKLEAVLPVRLRSRVRAVGSMTVPLATASIGVEPDALVTIAQACRGCERLRFDYRDAHGHESERTVEPYRLVHTGRRWYLVARDLRRRAWRTYRVDRMTGTTAMGHRFQLVDPPDAAALVSESVSVAPYRHRARIRVHAPVEEVAALVPATVGVLEATDDGATVLTTGANDLDAIALHLGVLGLGFTVLEPVELIERLRVLADRLTANHPRPRRTSCREE